MKYLEIFALILLLGLSQALYSPSSKVVKLTSQNFQQKVVNSDEIWFVEFYAPWCGHCQKLVPDWEKTANALKGIVNVGAVDMTTDQGVGAPYNIKGFPTIKFFGLNKNQPIDYNGVRSAQDLVNWVLDQAKRVATSRLGGGSGSSSYSSGGGSAGGSGSDRDVIVLTNSNFENLLMRSDDMWIVEFYAPWCGHCKNLEPEWNKAATNLKGEVKVAKVDATAEQSLGQRFGIRGYPTIKLFPPGQKADNLVEDYEGARDAGSITAWATEKKNLLKPALKVEQLVERSIFKTYCEESKGACIITFLPHIYDSSANERNIYIDTLTQLSNIHKAKPVSFLWSQGGDQFPLEEKLSLGSGYPAVVALSLKKQRFSVMRGAFNLDNLNTFIIGLLTGKEATYPVSDDLPVNKVQRWDGKDKKPETSADDDLSLDDNEGSATRDDL